MISITKDLETGISKIDAQHRELCTRINAVLSAGAAAVTKEETEKTLRFLGEYVIQHFQDEEKLQQESRYPAAAAHKAQHQTFIASFKKLQNDFNITGPSARFTLTVNQTIIDWLVKHIKSEDVTFGKYFNNQV